jgi:DNA-directed RNA polymerase specialized sigma24 family protein
METLEQAKQSAGDLHWLATLLTGRREIATDVTMQALTPADDPNAFFSTWIQQWSRRIVIASALAAVREDLARSAHRTALIRGESSVLPPASWMLRESTTKADLERALLAVDVFPRAALLLLIFERVPLQEAAILLDSEPALVRVALAGGLRDLTINLARMQGWTSAENNPVHEEVQNV